MPVIKGKKTMKHGQEKIESQIAKAAAARSAASIQADVAYDYIEVGKVKFYRPQLAHVWLLLKIAQKDSSISPDDRAVVMAYILANSAEAVRNKCLVQSLRGNITEAAYLFMMDNGLNPDEVFPVTNELAADVFEKKTTMTATLTETTIQDQESSPSGGAK